MNEIRITIRCTANEHHAKILRLDALLGMEFAETLAELLDGTSPFYIHRPGGRDQVDEWPGGKGSPIGRCGICGAPYTCTVTRISDRGQAPDVNEQLKESLEGGDAKPDQSKR